MSVSRRARDFAPSRGRLAAIAGLCVAGLALAACGGTGERIFSGVIGNVPEPEPVASAVARPEAMRCPRVDIQSGTETLTVRSGNNPEDPRTVRYQATITETARECRAGEGRGTLKIGVAGRVILGPAGQPGTYNVPVRIVVTRGLREPVYSQLRRAAVSVPAGQGSASFRLVDDQVTFPLGADETFGSYRVLIGFDEAG